jgi:hypothetical protein
MTIEEMFKDDTFRRHLSAGIKEVKNRAVFSDGVGRNPFWSLHDKGFLNVENLQRHFGYCLHKVSSLPASERKAVMILVQDALIKANSELSEKLKNEKSVDENKE